MCYICDLKLHVGRDHLTYLGYIKPWDSITCQWSKLRLRIFRTWSESCDSSARVWKTPKFAIFLSAVHLGWGPLLFLFRPDSAPKSIRFGLKHVAQQVESKYACISVATYKYIVTKLKLLQYLQSWLYFNSIDQTYQILAQLSAHTQ